MWWRFMGILPAQMNSMVPGTHMGRLFCPKPTLFDDFVGISSFPGKLQVVPASLAYFPLWGPAAAAEGLRYATPPPPHIYAKVGLCSRRSGRVFIRRGLTAIGQVGGEL